MKPNRASHMWTSFRGKFRGDVEEFVEPLPEPEQVYEYFPVDSVKEIRLVTILPSASSGPVECIISRIPRSWSHSYEAISYSSVDSPLSGTVICEGRVLAVTEACENVLRALRGSIKGSKQSRKVWIDEICINQSDTQERSRQVARIGEVFQNATRTIIYLGSSDSTTSLIRNMLRDIEVDRWQLDRYLLHESKVVAAWRDFFGRSWFRRTWIIPAVMLSPSLVLQIGLEEMAWSALEILAAEREVALLHTDEPKSISKFGEVMTKVSLPYIFRLRKSLYHRHRASVSGDSRPDSGASAVDSAVPSEDIAQGLKLERLLDVMVWTAKFECQDPRDKLYAVLPIFENPISRSLVPDYDKPTAEVFTSLAQFLLDTNPVALLSQAGRDSSDADLPSWCIDWRVTSLPSQLVAATRRLRTHAGYPEAGGIMRYELRNNTLFMRGIIVDQVSDLGETCPFAQSSSIDAYQRPVDVFRDIDEWEHQNATWLRQRRGYRHTEDHPICNKNCPESHRLPELIRLRLGLVPRARSTSTSNDRDEHEGITRMKDLLSPDLSVVQQDYWSHGHFTTADKEKEYNMIARRCVGRRLAVSEVGLTGIVPGPTRQGDHICILLGCKLPFILRQRPGGGWRLIGECIVGGIMHGEAVAWLDWANVEETVPEEPFRDFGIR